jgi:CRP-like cAMP-binding protein
MSRPAIHPSANGDAATGSRETSTHATFSYVSACGYDGSPQLTSAGRHKLDLVFAIADATSAGIQACSRVPAMSRQVYAEARRSAVDVVGWTRDYIQRRNHTVSDTLDEKVLAARNSVIGNRFRHAGELSAEEASLVERTNQSLRSLHQAGSEIVAEGEHAPSPMFIIAGWACTICVLPNGRRQIINFHLPGEAIALRRNAFGHAPLTVVALSTVECVDAKRVLQLNQEAERYPGVARALRHAEAQAEARTAMQVVRLGAQDLPMRVANLLVELHERMSEAGCVLDGVFPMPVTLETIADAVGADVRKVRGAMLKLQKRKVAALQYSRLRVLDLERLRQMGGVFGDPDTMHIMPRPASGAPTAPLNSVKAA